MVLRKLLIAIQIIILILTALQTRTSLIWIWMILSFFPPLVMCFLPNEKNHIGYVLASFCLLFLSQHAVFVFSHSLWGYSFNGDSINDFHVASVISNQSHFELGKVGYSQRSAYSYYPLLHIFSVFLSQISSLPLSVIAVFIVPSLNVLLVPILLYLLNKDFFGLKNRERNLAILFFATSWYYTYFYSQFIREVYAFPLVLLSLWVAVRLFKNNSPRQYTILLPLLFFATVMSHHISSYLLFTILLIITIGFNISHHNRQLNTPMLLMVVMLLVYTSFVAFNFTISQVKYVYEGLQGIFAPESFSIMKPYESWSQYLSYGYYAIISFLALLGGLKYLKFVKIKKSSAVIMTHAFFAFSFILCVILRLSTSADPWSWTYYMSLRGTIWAFIGFSVLVALGIKYGLKINSKCSLKGFFVLCLIISVLAVGKFSQYPLIISDSTIKPDITYSRYAATIWLKNEAVHGDKLLVAPYASNLSAFDISRSMAPYAYLNEYFLDVAPYDQFVGYIPFVGEYYEQYRSSPSTQIVYSNGATDIGYRNGT